MIILSWNCRGLGNPAIVPVLSELVKARRPDIVFLSETLAVNSRIEDIRVRLNFQSCFTVNCVGRSGGIYVFWKESSLCNVVSFSNNHIDLIINENGIVLIVLLLGIYSDDWLLLIIFLGYASVIIMT